MSSRALFLDRDGVINVNHGYVVTPERTDFIDGIFDLCRVARERGYLTVVVTNQAGIARGYYSEHEFTTYMDWMRGEFERRGSGLDAVYFCPHHPEHGRGKYLSRCKCRKPEPGMLLVAVRDFGIDVRQSMLIGDKAADIEAASRAGIGRACLLGWRGDHDKVAGLCRSTSVCKAGDLAEAMTKLFPGSTAT